MSSMLVRHAEGLLYADEIVYQKQSVYQRIVVTRGASDGVHRLYLDGHLQFSELDEYRYHESLVHPTMSIPGERSSVLILGGGDGMAAREVLKYPDVERIDLVDLDPAMTTLCIEYPKIASINEGALLDDRLTIHHMDAMRFLRESAEQYDRVILDLPDPHNESLSKLYSVEFYRMLRRRLRDDGVFVSQSTSPWLTNESYWSICSTIEEAGYGVRSYWVTVPSFGIWGFHVGGRDRPVLDGLDEGIDRRFMDDDALRNAQVFSMDLDRVEGRVNSIFEPSLYLMYHREINTGRSDRPLHGGEL